MNGVPSFVWFMAEIGSVENSVDNLHRLCRQA